MTGDGLLDAKTVQPGIVFEKPVHRDTKLMLNMQILSVGIFLAADLVSLFYLGERGLLCFVSPSFGDVYF